MADNTILNAGSGGDTVRDVDRAGVKTPVVAIDLNPAGSETLMAGAMPVSGTFWQSTQPVSGTVAISGTVAVASVGGNVEITNDVGNPIPVSGTVAATQSGAWNARAQDGTGNSLTSLLVGSQRAITVAVVDASGAQVTSFGGAGGAGGTASDFGSAFPASGTAIGAMDSAGVNMAALNLDASGFLKVNVAAGGASGGTSSSFGAADPSTGTAAGFSDGTDLREARVFDLDAGAGAEYTLGVGIRLSASGGSVEGGTSTHPLRIDPTGTTTQPVSGTVAVTGTFWQSTQPISGTITANAGTGTFAVSAASLPLPSGASTAAKQPALGTAGSASTDVLTVQGIASMTPFKVDGSATTQPVSGTFWQVTQPVSGTLGATQSGTWTVQPGNTANTTAWLVTGTGGVFPSTQSGTWNIATVTTLTGITNNVTVVGTGTFATQATLAAGTALIGKTSASAETGTVYNGTTALTPKFAAISASASGATTVVAAVTSRKIRVLRWSLSSNGTVNAKWQSHVTPTDLTGLFYLTQFASAGGSYCPVGLFESVAGEALDLNLSAAVAVGGVLTYVEV